MSLVHSGPQTTVLATAAQTCEEPSAIALATCDGAGSPSVHMVLLNAPCLTTSQQNLDIAKELQLTISNSKSRHCFCPAAQTCEEPNAIALATCDGAGSPSVRMVLLKGYDERGFIFYTNYNSRKGRELAERGRAAFTVYWDKLQRSVSAWSLCHVSIPFCPQTLALLPVGACGGQC